MKRVIKSSTSAIKAASSGAASVIPHGLEDYYEVASRGEAEDLGYDPDYIADPETIQYYQDEGFEYDGIILARPEYIDALDDSNLGLLDVIVDGAERVAVQLVGGRICTVDRRDVERALGI